MRRSSIGVTALLLFCGQGLFRAQEAVLTKNITEKTLTMQAAVQAAQSAIGACTAAGFAPVVVITDTRGVTRLVMVADGGQYLFTEEARRKAYTAATLRASTADTQRSVAANPKRLLPPDAQLLIMGGGVPFFEGSQLIGAIGVDGGGSPELEDKCARAGVDRLKEVLHPEPPKATPQGSAPPR